MLPDFAASRIGRVSADNLLQNYSQRGSNSSRSEVAMVARRSDRVDECTGLENRRGGNSTVGSNPTSSAIDSNRDFICSRWHSRKIQHMRAVLLSALEFITPVHAVSVAAQKRGISAIRRAFELRLKSSVASVYNRSDRPCYSSRMGERDFSGR